MWFTTETLSGPTAPPNQHAFDCFTTLRVKLGANALPGITIVRIVGEWGFFRDTAPPAFDIRDWRMGFIVADTTDAGTSVPKTYDDDADFMYVDSLLEAVGGDNTGHTLNVTRRFDIHSQRKIEELDQTLFFSSHNAGETTEQVYMRARVLALLP